MQPNLVKLLNMPDKKQQEPAKLLKVLVNLPQKLAKLRLQLLEHLKKLKMLPRLL